jgi:V/A-type H+-transporting ATPase subunit I
MKKYAFMVYHKEYEAFLCKLRDLGVVHVKDVELGKTEAMTQVDKLEKLQVEIDRLTTVRQALEKDILCLTPWGEFHHETIDKLREAAYVIGFYTCPLSRYNPEWEEKYNALVISQLQSSCLFITITPTAETVEIDADASKLPPSDLYELREKLTGVQQALQEAETELTALTGSPAIEELRRTLRDEYNMSCVIAQTQREAEGCLMYLEGWVPASEAPALSNALEKDGCYCRELEIEEGDNVPIQLKNNAYARLFEPVTKMFSLPNYTELDPTPLLAPFFMLFFGLCFGDGGYGLLLLLAGFFLKKKMAPGMKPILSLLQWLGGTAVMIGLLTGTVFGIALVNIPALEAVKSYFLTTDNLMTLAIILGLLHIVFGKAVAAYKTKMQKGIRHSLAPWAWVFAITSALIVFGLPVLDIQLPLAVQYGCYLVAALCLPLIFFYNTPGKHIFLNFGSGIWALYNIASGLLGDTLSYIRLFAIGLTGGILGGVFNQLGVNMTETLPLAARIPVMLFILLVGHSLNFALCMISSLVHPIRLVFVEYFKNSEYEGGGKEYQPFCRTPSTPPSSSL